VRLALCRKLLSLSGPLAFLIPYWWECTVGCAELHGEAACMDLIPWPAWLRLPVWYMSYFLA